MQQGSGVFVSSYDTHKISHIYLFPTITNHDMLSGQDRTDKQHAESPSASLQAAGMKDVGGPASKVQPSSAGTPKSTIPAA
jgi:hypothetical protein